MLMLLALGCLHAGEIPSAWHDLGRTVELLDGGQRYLQTGNLYCIDVEGRWVYDGYLRGINIQSGEVKRYYATGGIDGSTGQLHSAFPVRNPMERAAPILVPSETLPEGIVQISAERIFYASKDRLGFYEVGPTGWPWDSDVCARLDGTPFRLAKGELDLVKSGIDLILPLGNPGYVRGYEKYPHNVVTIRHESKEIRVKLPAPYVDPIGITNGVDWGARTAYVSINRKKDPRPLIAAISLGSNKAVRLLPAATALTAFNYRDFPSTSSVLRDGSICVPLIERVPEPKKRRVATLILDKSHKKWRLISGLAFYGSSYGGEFVAYGWWGQGTMRIARVSSRRSPNAGDQADYASNRVASRGHLGDGWRSVDLTGPK